MRTTPYHFSAVCLSFPHFPSRNTTDNDLETRPILKWCPNFHYCRRGDSLNSTLTEQPQRSREERAAAPSPAEEEHSTLGSVHSCTAGFVLDLSQSIADFLRQCRLSPSGNHFSSPHVMPCLKSQPNSPRWNHPSTYGSDKSFSNPIVAPGNQTAHTFLNLCI